MAIVSIICLIYQSTKLADWVYGSLQRFTPMLSTGEAEFFFVANDATSQVLSHLDDNGYPYVRNDNEHLSEDDLFAMGIGYPEWMNRVYAGYNVGIAHAKAERVLLLNSDNFVSFDWLENLLKHSTRDTVVCSQLVEREVDCRFHRWPTALPGNFGKNPDEFDENEFLRFAADVRRDYWNETYPGGAYMPCLVYKDTIYEAGLYPPGNIAGATFWQIAQYGDMYLYERYRENGVSHITAKDSVVYHLKEGERDETFEVA